MMNIELKRLNPVAVAMETHIQNTAQTILRDIEPRRHASMVGAFGFALLSGDHDLALGLCKAEARMSEIVDILGDRLTGLGAPAEVPAGSNMTLGFHRFEWLQAHCEALRERDPLIREFHQLWQSRLLT